MRRLRPSPPGILLVASGLLAWGIRADAQTIPAFPGAEGAGAFAKGGRGGDVYHVTNTNASGPGSLAYGLTTGVPAAGRTIVFDVSGYATLSSVLRVTASKITIAGQTAPGDGFGIKGNTFRISGDDVVIRHLRFRSGHTADAINMDSGSLNSIFDHCDAMFSGDENFSSFDSPPENMTWQWSLNAWGRESHSCGGLWDQGHATGHHSLWAHNHTRNPKARPSVLDWINNVTFDWDIGFIMGDSETPANWNANVRGNYFVCAPGNLRSRALEKANLDRNGVPNFSIFVENNLFDKDGDGILNGQDYGYGIASGSFNQLPAPLANNGAAVAIDHPLTAYKKIVSAAGPLRMESDPAKPLRDEVTAILINNLVTQKPHHISSVSQTGASNGGFGTLNSAVAPVDTDKDGMPDFYETALGWSAAAQDHNSALASSGGVITGTTFFPANTPAGYTRLEEYLHFKALPHGVVPRNVSGAPTSLAIDLRKFTGGFSASPTFTVANVIGGGIALSGAGNALATFTPTLNYTGRARFEFTVTDAQGSAWTQTCAIVVTNNALPRDLVWKGDSATNAWDTSTANWLRNNAPTAFGGGDFATFDDSGSKSPAVAVNAGAIAAGGIAVNSSGNYTFSGSGTLTGPLTKRGPGSLAINNTGANTLTPATLEEGTLALPSGGGLGAGTLTLSGGTLALGISPATAIALAGDAALDVSGTQTLSGALSGAGTLQLTLGGAGSTTTLAGSLSGFGGTIALGASNGALRLNSSSTAFTGSAAATFDLGTGGATLLNRNGNITIDLGALRGGPNTFLSGAGSNANPTTYNIGANGASTTFAGKIVNGSGSTAITKAGAGTLILSGANTHTGATNVNAGEFLVDGSLGNTAVSVANGARLGGSGTLAGSVTANSGATLSPGSAPNSGGALTVNGGLTLNGSTLLFDLTSSPAGANDTIVMNGGTLGLNGTQHFEFRLLHGALAPGTYELITGATTSTASNAALTHNLPADTRQTFVLSRPPAGSNPSYVRLTVTGDPATLTWTGASSNYWDMATSNNWTGATPNTFTANDAVVFNDTSAVNNINLPAAVAPRSITFSNATRAYTLGGTGGLSAGHLVKSGPGGLVLSGANAHGQTTVNSGATITLSNDIANAGALGTGPLTLNGGTLTMFDNSSTFGSATYHLVVPNGQTGTLNADARCDLYGTLSGNGTLNFRVPWVRTTLFTDWSDFAGTINVTTDADGGDLRMATDYNFPGFPLARVHLSAKVTAYFAGTLAQGAGTGIEIGELSGDVSSKLMGGSAASGGRALTYYIGGRGNDATFAGTIAEQDTAVTRTSFVKRGTGVWTLSGPCSWNGGTTIEAGTLRVGGSLTSNGGNFAVLSGATLDLTGGTIATADLKVETGGKLTGTGTITGDLANQGTVTCGSGALTITGDVVNNGTMRLTGGATLNASGRFVNNGVLDLLTAAVSLPANLENNGVIIDTSSLSRAQVAKTGNSVTVTVQTFAGHTYQLQRSDSLTPPAWVNLGGGQAGDGSVRAFTDPAASGAQRFYRVLVTP